MDSATLRQEVSTTDSELRASQRDLTFAVAEENNTDDKEKKGEIGNKIEKLKGDIGVNASRHSSAVQDLRAAEAVERREETAKQTEEQRVQETEKQKTEEAVKPEEKELDKKDKKPSEPNQTASVLIGGQLYDVSTTDGHEDPEITRARLFAQLQEHAASGARDPHEIDTQDQPAVAANVAAASTAPAIASTGSTTGVTQDTSTPTATSRIQGAAGSSAANT